MHTRNTTYGPSLAATRATVLGLIGTLLLGHAWVWADLGPRHPSADHFPSDVASTWFEALYDVVKAERPLRHRPHGFTASLPWRSTSRSWPGRKKSLVRAPVEWAAVGAPAQETPEVPLADGGERHPCQHDPGSYPALSQASLDAINDPRAELRVPTKAEFQDGCTSVPSRMGRRSPRRSSRGPPPMGSRSTITASTSRCRCREPGSRRRRPSIRTPCSRAGA